MMTERAAQAHTTAEHALAQEGERAFLFAAGGAYVLVSLLLMAALEREWVANVDVQTFLAAARSFRDGGSPFDLYEVSRAASPWPYAYPPLFAIVIAPFVAVADAAFGTTNDTLPALVAIRLPLWGVDIAVAALISRFVRHRAGSAWLGRVGALLWLFSPILFYHTLVQAHVESLWLLPVLAAYERISRGQRGWAVMALLGVALAVKQTALLFAIPFGLVLLMERRWREVVIFPIVLAGIFGAISLPFLAYSGDYLYMITGYVSDMPLQVQSWQVWTLALESYRIDQVRTTFPTVRYVLYLSLAVTTLLSIIGLAQRRAWPTIGLLIALGFFLTAHKAIGYHYPMLLLWLILYGLTERRFPTLTFALGWSTWVVVSPYYANWADPARLAFYALLGTLNSLYYVYLLIDILRKPALASDSIREELRAKREERRAGETSNASGSGRLHGPPLQTAENRGVHSLAQNPVHGATVLLTWGAIYFWGFALAGLANPIRYVIQDQIPDSDPLRQLGALIILLLVLLWLTYALTRPTAAWLALRLRLPNAELRRIPWTRAHTGVWIAFGVLFFTWFTMNAEVTRLLERGLWVAWGLD